MKSVSSRAMRRLDRLAVSRYHIPTLLLMDHAGRQVAEEARRILVRPGKSIVVMTGGGHNGGDGVAAARYLYLWGFRTRVFWMKNPAAWTREMAIEYRMAKAVGVPFLSFLRIPPRLRVPSLKNADLLIDALLGTGVSGQLRVTYFDAITAMNVSRRPILAVDIPSGMDPDTGFVSDAAVKAHTTVALAAAKSGEALTKSKRYVGRLIIADIGLPMSPK